MKGLTWLGAIIAALMSWQANGSYVWAIVHAMLSWIYVAYALVFK